MQYIFRYLKYKNSTDRTRTRTLVVNRRLEGKAYMQIDDGTPVTCSAVSGVPETLAG